MMKKHGLLPAIYFGFALPFLAPGQSLAVQTATHSHSEKIAPITFIQNLNQWEEPVRFRAFFEGNHTLFLEDKCFTYLLSHPADLEKIHHENPRLHAAGARSNLRMHAYKVHFLHAREPKPEGADLQGKRHHYFLGRDSSKWASKVPSFGKVIYRNLYPGIDLHTYSREGHFKYDFIIGAFQTPQDIQLLYEGADQLKIVEGNLVISTTVEVITEYQPVAWQMKGDRKVPVVCHYKLDGNTVSFSFPYGYDPALELIIDPTVVASTVAGTANLTDYGTFGHSATFDQAGNIYTGGRCFGVGYPATTGAFDLDFNGGNVDIAISKYNATGTDLIYATYLGGANADLPHSLVTDFNQRLYIFGSSNSGNYPIVNSAYQTTTGGGTDIIVTVLSPDGASLVGSSYFGGSNDDGINGSTLNANYGDEFRGEIILDGQNNIYVAASSRSFNFPTTAGAYDTSFNLDSGPNTPAQDVVVFKASSDLSALYWSTYLGGDDTDIGNGLRLDNEGNVYVTGTAGHSNFPTTAGTIQDSWPGGNESAFIAKISADGNSLLASTFWGTSGDDHSYFLDIDEDNNIHIYGQSTGMMPVTPGTYSTGNSSRVFLSAFDAKLENVVYSTVFGNDSAFDSYDLVPVAFMVDKCNQIYFSGYYANDGLPTSAGAFNTQGDNFYLGVLEPLATGLTFGTYFGDANHVDGGTSRFDKAGVVYQGVCSCQWSGVLDTNPDAWESVQVSGCDVGVFKIDFEIETVTAAAAAFPGSSGCAPFAVDFMYTGQDATSFSWDFGDGSPVTTLENPSHTFFNAGSYEVTLAVNNANACNIADTFYLQIDVLDGGSTLSEYPVCDNNQIILDAATPNATYTWQDGSTAATLVTSTPGIYWVDIQLPGCLRRDSFLLLPPGGLEIDLGADTVLCDVNSMWLDASHPSATAYLWSTGSQLPQISVAQAGLYWVELTDAVGCSLRDSLALGFAQTPTLFLGNDTTLCPSQSIVLDATTQNATYLWQDGSTHNTYTPTASAEIWAQITVDGCSAADTVWVEILPPILLDETVGSVLCYGDCNGSITVSASGGVGGPYVYQWENGEVQTARFNLCAQDYSLTVTDIIGCTETQVIQVSEPPPLQFEVTKKDNECYGENTGAIAISQENGGIPPYLYALNQGIFTTQTQFTDLAGGNYVIWIQDANGCEDSTHIYLIEPQAFDVYAGADQHIRLGQEIMLHGRVLPDYGQAITWTPPDYLTCTDCLEPSLLPFQTTLYTFTATDPQTGCTRSDEVLVTVELLRNVYIPNAWSPNGDGFNDQFTIFAGPEVARILELQIFDRWGELVYENYNFPPNDPGYGWDGRFKAKEMKPAVFVYFARVQFIDGVESLLEGDVTLVR